MNPLLYTTAVMLAPMDMRVPVPRFLKNRYFPTDETSDLFTTEEVLMDIQDGNQLMAPVVLPKKRAITVDRESFRTDRMIPPLVAPQRVLSVDELNKRGFGEAFLGSLRPDQREAVILAKDIETMVEMHERREEYIAAQCMLNNGYTLMQYADDYGGEGKAFDIYFYDGTDNPAVYTPSEPWNGTNPNRYADMGAMVRMLTRAGRRVSDAVMSPDVMDELLNDETVYKLLDNLNSEKPIEKTESGHYLAGIL